MTAQKKRDILEELLRGRTENSSTNVAELDKLIHRESTEAKQPAKRKKSKPKRTGKRKTTHYLNQEVIDDLDEAKSKLNALLQKQLDSRVSKSAIVNHALKLILKDFEEKGEKSPFIQEILKDIFTEND